MRNKNIYSLIRLVGWLVCFAIYSLISLIETYHVVPLKGGGGLHVSYQVEYMLVI